MLKYAAVVCLCCLSGIAWADEPAGIEQASAARTILDRWHGERAEPNERFLHLICWTPSDRELPANYQTRLTRIMTHIQDFYAQEMSRFGFIDHTIRLQHAQPKPGSEPQLRLHTAIGKHPTAHYHVQSGNEVRDDCVEVLSKAGIDPKKETILIICNLATWDEKTLEFKHKSPYYASGSFRAGTGWQLDSPELDTRNLALTEPKIRDGQYGRISLGKHNSIFIGGIAHELGHALGLPHCKQRIDESVRGTALMGSGNRTYGDELRGEGRGTFLTLAHALRLASHPQFSRSTKGIGQAASAEISELSIDTVGKAIEVSGVVTGNVPVYAVVAYFDPTGSSDYDATTATTVPDEDGKFSIRSDALVAGKGGELRLFPLHVNGSAAGQMSRTRFRYPYRVAPDGKPDLSTFHLKQELQPLVIALSGNRTEAAQQLATQMKSEKTSAIAQRLLHPEKQSQSPAQFDGNAKTTRLTKFKASAAKVGWGRPTFDRVPDNTMLLDSGEQIFGSGIYAHAPARHVYEVAGKWSSLSGKVGLAAGHPGTVRFQIIGDGESLWRSKLIRPSELEEFSVNLNGVNELELLVEPTEDGNGADWGLWLEPTLGR